MDYQTTPLPLLVELKTFSWMTGSCASQMGMRCVSAHHPSPVTQPGLLITTDYDLVLSARTSRKHLRGKVSLH